MSAAQASGALDGLTLFRFAHIERAPTAGGVEAYLHALNTRLLQRHRMRIAQTYLVDDAQGIAPPIEVERIGQGELVWLPSRSRALGAGGSGWLRQGWQRLRASGGLRHTIDHGCALAWLLSHRPDLSLFHYLSEDAARPLRHLRAAGVPLAACHHFSNAKLREWSFARLLRQIPALGVVSQADLPRAWLGRASVLLDGVDTAFFDPAAADGARVSHPSPGRGPLLLLASRIYRGKGQLDALAALDALQRAGTTARLALAGRVEDAAFGAELRAAIAARGLQAQVQLVGEVSAIELRDWYAASDVVLLPSLSEGLPRTVLEAQAMARPVVAYDVGGTGEALLDGHSGHLVRSGDVAGLVGRLRGLLADAPMRRAMGQCGRERICREFSLAALAQRHESFCLRAIGRAALLGAAA